MKSKLHHKPSPQPKLSKNSLEVQRLRGIVKSLSDQLEENQLISDSLEHDVDKRVMELEEELHEEHRRHLLAEIENKEYKGHGRRKF